MKTAALDELDAACTSALSHCQNILDRAGLEMTTGGEIEWYSMLPEGGAQMSPQEAANQYIALITENPELLTKGILVPSSSALESFSEEVSRRKNDPMRWSWHIAADDIENAAHPVLGLNELLKARIAKRMLDEGIPLQKAHKERGEINTAVTVVDYDGNQYQATGQQLEVSIGVEGPEKLAAHLKRIRTIIREESKALRLAADFRSLPPYAPTPSALHVHYGLRFADSRRNAFLAQDGTSANELADSCSESATRLLNNGGLLLVCPSENDYGRLEHMGMRLSAGQYDTSAVQERQTGFSNYHKELRIPGGNAPPSAAVLLTALSVTDGVLSALGQKPGPLEHATLAEDARATLKARTIEPAPEKEEIYQSTPRLSFQAARQQLTADSMLAHYTPEVYESLQQLRGQAIYR